MLKEINKMIKKLFFIYIFLATLISISSNAEIINKIEISGNERITDETIVLFSGIKLNQDIDQSDLNNIIKKLYETSFFENISIDTHVMTL